MKKIFIYIGICSMMLISCKKQKELNVDLSSSILDGYQGNVTDEWLKNNFLDVYNMEVLYRFDGFQLGIDNYSTPVKEEKVQPIMNLVQKGFIDPYLQITSKNFFMPRVPKVFALFGGALYRAIDNTALAAGTADAGRQINLFVVNDYNPANSAQVIGSLHTIHHEFTHILNQTIPVPEGYEEISNNYLGDNWQTAPLSDADRMGFISRYSRKNKMEDFAEMVAHLLVNGQSSFDAKAIAVREDAGVKLRLKEQMVVNYFRTAYGIDFRALQTAVKQAIINING